MPSLISLITQQQIPVLLLDTNQVTWCCMCTVILSDLVNQKHEGDWLFIFSISISADSSKKNKNPMNNGPTPHLMPSVISCFSISFRIQNCSALPLCTNHNTTVQYTRISHPSTTSNTNINWQIYFLSNLQFLRQTENLNQWIWDSIGSRI